MMSVNQIYKKFLKSISIKLIFCVILCMLFIQKHYEVSTGFTGLLTRFMTQEKTKNP